MLIKLNDREHATIVAALMSWVENNIAPTGLATTRELESIATNNSRTRFMSVDEVTKLVAALGIDGDARIRYMEDLEGIAL